MSSKTLVCIYQFTQRHIPEDRRIFTEPHITRKYLLREPVPWSRFDPSISREVQKKHRH
jgi:hypothetical protein